MVVSTPQRTANGIAVAAAAHALLLGALVSLMRVAPHSNQPVIDHPEGALIWLPDGVGGGRGGSGSNQPGRARPLRRSGHDRNDLPSSAPAPSEPRPIANADPEPIPPIAVPVTPIGSGDSSIIGVIGAIPTSDNSLGAGDGGRAGRGKGDGYGDDHGSTFGSGGRRGIGDGPGGVGSGLVQPAILSIERPRYTNDAMRARIQGTVTVECTVQPNGFCSDIHVVRSLDRTLGLDEEARRAAALWRFKPGSRSGRAVPMIVRIELEFTIR